MNILIVPDKFKGTLKAGEVCEAIEAGLRDAAIKFKSFEVPMADGGDGTSELLEHHLKGHTVTAEVLDPIGRDIWATYGISEDKTIAFIEMASASGLDRLEDEKRSPAYTSTYGTGQLIHHAVKQGIRQIILGIGGSATNDGGMGMACALGGRFLNSSGDEIVPMGRNLIDIAAIDLRNLKDELRNVKFTILCDVRNPLYGPNGATHVFAPQKGADIETIEILESGIITLADVIKKQFNFDSDFPGAGAGGGIGVCCKLLFDCQFFSGTEFLIQFLKIERLVEQCDIVISGEGKLDHQTGSGKVVKGIADLCWKHQKPLYVVAGKSELTQMESDEMGICKLFCLTDSVSEVEAMKNAFQVLRDCAKNKLAPAIGLA